MSVKRVVKKFSLILSSHQKIRIAELVILMILGGAMETLSVSLMAPFMSIAMNPEETMDKPFVKALCSILHIDSANKLLIVLSIGLAILYLAKNGYLLFEYNVQYKFVYNNMFTMQRKLLNSFIHRPYEYFLGISSGEVIRIINNDTSVVFNLLTTLLSLFTEVVVSGMIIATVFVLAPIVTVIMAVVLVFLVLIINRIIQPILKSAGKENQIASSGMNKWLLQSIQGIKELKVTSKEEYFEDNYNVFGQRSVNAFRKNAILSMIPRFFIEAACMSVVFIAVGISIYLESDIEFLVPMLTVIAVAAARLLPSVNRLSSALASIAYGEPMLDKLIENLRDISGQDQVSLAMNLSEEEHNIYKGQVKVINNEIVLSQITYKYPNTEVYILNNAEMRILKGQSVGLVGVSGAGKTTLVDIMLGLLSLEKGQVLVDGNDIKTDMSGWLRQIGYIPQSIFMLDDSIRVNVAFGEQKISDDEVWRSLKDAALYDYVKSLPKGLDTEIGEHGVRLSGGQRQRIGIARALYSNPDVLIFDEATSALDNETEAAIMESVNKLQGRKTMIIIAHRLTTIENCDVVYRIENGKIIKIKG